MKKLYFSKLLLLIAFLGGLNLSTFAQTTTYSTPGSYNYTVSGVTLVAIDAGGAQGGTSSFSAPGGLGGRVQAYLTVSSGQVLYVTVGGQGTAASYCSSRAGGSNGGGNGYGYGGGGGGMSDIRLTSGAFSLTNEYIVAGGGGGAGADYDNSTEVGGFGGGTTAGTGYQGNPGTASPSLCGSGGSQTGPGLGATSYTCCAPNGSTSGGAGGSSTGSYCYAGGGGGGYYGGGCGAFGGGGGGSSYAGTGTSSVVHTPGYQTGNGYVKITPVPPTVTSAPTSVAFGAIAPSTTSTPQIIALTGIALTPSGTLTLTATPSNYQISFDGSTYSSSLTYNYTGNSFSSLLMYVQFTPAAITSYSGSITVAGGGQPTNLSVPISGSGAAACSGTPTAGSATINGGSSASGNSSTSFVLNVPGATIAGGITYQWQVSTTSSTTGFANIPGAVSASFTYSGLSANSWFKCIVSCGGSSATSTVVTGTFTLPSSSCTPAYNYNCSSYPMSTSINTFVGASGSISDPSACGPNYVDNSGSMSVTVNPGTAYSMSYGLATSYWSSFAVETWIDFNNDGAFATSEIVGGFAQGGASSSVQTSTITIPAGVAPGAYRMRVVGIYNPTGYGFPNYPTMPPCPTSSIYYGNTRDYKVIVTAPSPSLTATAAATFGNVIVGGSSVPVAFTMLKGSALVPVTGTGFVTVTAPTSSPFLVSTNGTSWSTSVLVPYAFGVLNPTNVYIQFNPTATGTFSGNVAITGGGVASTVNVAVSGTGVSTSCSGTPTSGSASIAPTSGGSTTSFTLTLPTASTSDGLFYQWQSSPTGTVWTNIAAGIYPSYTFTGISATTQFRCIITCGTGASSTSAPVTATFTAGTVASSSCTPSFANTCSSYPMSTSINSLIGASGSISDPAACGPNYADNTSTMSVTLNAGTTYSLSYGLSPSYYSNFSVETWIDFNNDGTFATSEIVGGLAQGGASSSVQASTITLPAGLLSGSYRMRVVGIYCPSCYGYAAYPNIPFCPTTSINYGNARDYKVTILGGAAPCSGQPLAGIVSPTPLANCGSFAATLSNVGETAAPGMVYQWQSSTNPTSGFTSISGATNSVYVPTLTTPGTLYFRDSVNCTSSLLSANSPSRGITYLAAPTAITGSTTICNGTSATLGSTPTGGTWTIDNPSVATIGSTSGVITGVITGTSAAGANVTYTAPSGCITTTAIVVNPQPSAITGTTTFCGSQTSVLAATPSGGTWSSSNIGVASTAGSISGTVTGIPTGGTAIITYTLPTGCISTKAVTVNPLGAITGVPNICIGGFTTTLADAISGGTWSSSNPAVGTINSFGVATSISLGSTTISYSMPSTGCVATQVVFVTAPASPYAVTGGGHFCTGSTTGVAVNLAGTDAGTTYQLYNGSTAIGSPITGAGFGITFGLQTLPGVYGVIGGTGACALTMPTTVTVSLDPLPTQYTVSATNSGFYCAGGSGVHVFLNSSTIGINYQLFNLTTPVGSLISGTSSVLDFGTQPTGSYTVVGTNTVTGCVNAMSNTQIVTTTPTPAVFTMSAGGGYCTGGAGIPVSLSGSVSGVSYQLYLSGSPVGSPVTGTGTGTLPFGVIATSGTYSAIATNTVTGCTSNMTGSTLVTVNALPSVFTVTGGGSYCTGGSGVHVGLNSSTSGVNYQLYLAGTSLGTSYVLAGTGASIDYGLLLASGAYTVVATNATSGCTSNMFGSTSIAINTPATPYPITGGGSYCSGGTGVVVGLGGSQTGVNYQLFNTGTLVSAASGTGSSLSFGLQTGAGSLYNVVATNSSTGCVSNMPGSVTIVINPLPVSTYSVTGGGSYCVGGVGVPVGLSGTQSGVSYQLALTGVPFGSATVGSGSSISFGNETAAGAYTVVATSIPGCISSMTSSTSVSVNALPTTYSVTGGGGYCAGTTGTHIGTGGSDIGLNYQLYNGSVAVGTPVAGIGAALDFGLITTTGVYTVSASNTVTTCSVNMLGSTTVSVNANPTAYPIAPSSSAYCAGTSGSTVTVNTTSVGVNYGLYRSGTLVSTLSGTGSAITFGSATAGTYSVVASALGSGCTTNMTGTSVVTATPLPTVFAMTGGGAYCAGSLSTLHAGVLASTAGVSYQLMNGTSPVGIPVIATGAAIDFGVETSAGTYTVVANGAGCTNNMSGTAVIAINPVPSPYTVTGGGAYCLGGTGVPVGITNTTAGINYQVNVGGVPTGAPFTGTGAGIAFGAMTTAGTYSVVATNLTTGCTATMPGTPAITNYPALTSHNVTGGGRYCPGGTGVSIGLDSATTGTSYQVYVSGTAVGSLIPGTTGSPINFGLFTTPGTYTVLATNSVTSCTSTMAGSATVNTHTLPTAFAVTGGGNYCPGGTGVAVTLGGSTSGISYQLYNGIAVGAAVPGTGSPISFGLETGTGTYTVTALNTLTGCQNAMVGNTVVGISPLPALHTVTGGGQYCVGGTGVHVGLNGSNTGLTYQLYSGSTTAVGTPMAGTGSTLDFGLQTAGSYTIVANSGTTTCNATMTGAATIVVNSLPAPYAISAGSTYCSGGTGVDVAIAGSDAGVNYQLYNGTSLVGFSMAGTGSAIDFGMQTVAGNYTVVATSLVTTCSNNMTGVSNIAINPAPVAFNVTGGGNYCGGTGGAHVMLGGSGSGFNYQLVKDGVNTGSPVAGTGFNLDFGLHTIAGVYTVVATNTSTGCNGGMTGSAVINISPAPTVYTTGGAGSSYCQGGTGIDLSLSGSDLGVSYQLYNGTTPVGSAMSGSGATLDLGFQTATGSYTVVAVNNTTACTSNMAGSAGITINPLPNVFTITGGGNFCTGGTGVHIGLSNSNAGISYQLVNSGTGVGTPISGTGGAIDFGAHAGTGSYVIVATNSATLCSTNMAGTATVSTNPLPAVYNVTGGGNYCEGASGLHVNLSGSALGIKYQLYKAGVATGSPMTGSGFALDFGAQTDAAAYTVEAVNNTTGCTSNMLGTATVVVNVLPHANTVIGGGNYCAGGTGSVIGLAGSATGVTYQLYNGSSASGTAVSGSGSAISFGAKTAAGTYTVIALDGTTHCTATMTGGVTVAINPLPSVFNVIGGGSLCAGGAGVHVGLSGSEAGISYQLFNTTPSGVPAIGTGSVLDLGAQTTAGTYTVIASNSATTCTNTMSSSAAVIVNPAVTPFVSISTGVGDTVCAGALTTFTASPVHGGSAASYRWSINGIPTSATGNSYSYLPLNGDVIGVQMTSTAACATPPVVSNSFAVTVQEHEMPSVVVTPNPGAEVCQGTMVTFAATPTYGGSAPSYSWIIGGSSVGTASTYSYVPANGDIVYCVLTSNYHCRLANTASSNQVTMQVDLAVMPVVTVSDNATGAIVPGQAVTFTATQTGGGSSATYQWFIDGVAQPGATGAVFVTNNLNNMDSVTCQVTSGGGCSGNIGANTVIVHTSNVGVKQVVSSGGDIQLVPNPNKGTFMVKGTFGTTIDQDVTLEITDMLGQVIYNNKVTTHNGEINEKIQLSSSIANGMYLLNLKSDSDNRVFHIVIEQ